MCDEGKHRFFSRGGGPVLRIFLAKKGAAGQISLRNTGLGQCLASTDPDAQEAEYNS